MRKSASLRCRAYQRKKRKANQTHTICVISAFVGIAILLTTLVACNAPKSEAYKGNEYAVISVFDATTEQNGNKHYHFRSVDGSEWWTLTQTQMRITPKGNAEYILVYNDMDTTDINDDEFIAIAERR